MVSQYTQLLIGECEGLLDFGRVSKWSTDMVDQKGSSWIWKRVLFDSVCIIVEDFGHFGKIIAESRFS